MVSIKKWTLCKILAVILCFFIIGEAHYALAGQDQNAGTATQADAFAVQFQAARTAYLAERYEEAKTVLEKLIDDLAAVEGRDTFRGRTYLLAGATYEKLKFKEPAIKYFCKAKAILGEDQTIEGIDLKNLKYYGEDCTSGAGVVAGAAQQVERRSFFGSIFGTLLFIAVGAALVWYLFFSPNAPFKKKSGSSSSTKTYSSTCFKTTWSVSIHSDWQGSVGEVTITPSDRAPQPNETNGWDDSVTYTLASSGGGTLLGVQMTMSVTVAGGDNGKRHDMAWVDGTSILDQTNTFTESCSAPGTRAYDNVYNRSSLGSFTLRHKVELSAGKALTSALKVVKK